MKCLNCNLPVKCKSLCHKHYMTQYNKTYAKSDMRRASIRKPKNRFNSSKSQALRRGTEWSLTLEQYIVISKNPCFYCKEIFNECGSGLDRKDSKGPYSLNNVLRCCGKCNYLKNKYLTVNETLAVIELLKIMRGGKVWFTG